MLTAMSWLTFNMFTTTGIAENFPGCNYCMLKKSHLATGYRIRCSGTVCLTVVNSLTSLSKCCRVDTAYTGEQDLLVVPKNWQKSAVRIATKNWKPIHV